MNKKFKFEFKKISSTTDIVKVRGGWIVRENSYITTELTGGDWLGSICFVPDPNHEWEIELPDRPNGCKDCPLEGFDTFYKIDEPNTVSCFSCNQDYHQESTLIELLKNCPLPEKEDE